MKLIYIIAIVTVFFTSCGNKNNSGNRQITKEEINIIPQPDSVSYGNGFFVLKEGTTISVDNKLTEMANLFAEMISVTTGIHLEAKLEENSRQTGIDARIDNSLNSLGEEGYKLVVDENQIQIRAFHSKGIFYAFQTLRQLMPTDTFNISTAGRNEWKIPCVTITDKPDFAWRGLMIDCSRTFRNKEFIKKYIDVLALYKLNVLHMHLTDDQGWRIEIKKYPELTEKGAGFAERYNEPKEREGYFTQADIKELVKYAEARNITIVPEIEMPGHTLAVLSVYPELSCTGGPFEIHPFFQAPGIHKDIFCAGNEETFQFLENVLDEVIELFPSEFIHIGGDEAPKERWQKCPKCQAKIKKENLHNEHELQSYFISRIEKYLNSKGRKLIGWDEILEGGLAPNAAMMYWRSWEKEAVQTAVNEGHPIVMSPTSHCYFDYDVRTISMEKAYSFNPVPKELTDEQAKLILGGQANMWTHIARSDSAIDAQVFPRLIALSEALWTKSNKKDFNDFHRRIGANYPILSKLGIQYGDEAEPITLKVSVDYSSKKVQIELLAGTRGAEIRYTKDATQPTPKSQLYKTPITPENSFTIRAQVYKNGRAYGAELIKEFTNHLAIGKEIHLLWPHTEKYNAGGKYGLVDGITGTKDYFAEKWQGFQGVDFEATIDLEDVKEINQIQISFLSDISKWIFPPKKVEFYISPDGVSYELINSIDNIIERGSTKTERMEFSALFENQKARFVKIYAESIITCPEWHTGAGNKAWLFTDEIVIK